MRKLYLFTLLSLFIYPNFSNGQSAKLAVEYLESLDKAAEEATSAFFDYASDRFLNQKEKTVAKRKNKMIEVVENQKNKIASERPFNGQLRLKNGYSNFLTKVQQFPDNLEPYSEVTIEDFRTGNAQKRKLAFVTQMENLKLAAAELNVEVEKYITMNKLRDYKKGSSVTPKWQNAATIFVYSQKIQEAVLTVGALDRDFYDTVGLNLLDKAETIRKAIIQNSASLSASIKIRPPVPTDFTIRESALNNLNLYRLDAFRNFKSIIDARKKEASFAQKYPNGAPKTQPQKTKYDAEKSQLDSQVSDIRNLAKELKKERDKHEKAFDKYLIQFVEKWVKNE
jgi:hypothetical protein